MRVTWDTIPAGLQLDLKSREAHRRQRSPGARAVNILRLVAATGTERRGGTPLAVGLVITAVASLQFGAGFAATLFDDLGPAGAAFLRLSIAAVVLVAIWRPRVRGRPRPHVRVAVVFGLVLGTMNVAIYSSMGRIPLGAAVTIEFLGPLGVAVAGSRRALDALWVLLAAAGILLLAETGGDATGQPLDALGVLFALVAAAAWAAYIRLSQRTGALWPGASGLAVAMVAGAVLAAPLGIAQAGGELLQPALLAEAAAVALLSSVIPYSLELEALRRLPARVFGILMSLEPAVAALAGLVVLGQSLGAGGWLAIVLVVVASAGATATATPQAAG
jgi:inner membrane transporter RhtA